MTVPDLMRALRAHAATLTLHGDRVKVQAPEPLPDALMGALRLHKAEIVASLRDQTARTGSRISAMSYCTGCGAALPDTAGELVRHELRCDLCWRSMPVPEAASEAAARTDADLRPKSPHKEGPAEASEDDALLHEIRGKLLPAYRRLARLGRDADLAGLPDPPREHQAFRRLTRRP